MDYLTDLATAAWQLKLWIGFAALAVTLLYFLDPKDNA